MAKSKLHFLGHIADLITVETDYNKKFDQYKGTPVLYNRGGLLRLVFDFKESFRFLERMNTINYDLYKLRYPVDDGKVVFYDANDDILKTWNFKDAPIVYYKVKFDTNGGGMRVEMIISPAIQDYGYKIHRSWHITPIEEETYQSPIYVAENTDEFYLSIKHLADKKTFVPFGIPAFNGTPENKNIEFEIEITENDIDDFQVEFLLDNKVIQTYYSGKKTLDEVIVTAKGSGNSSSSNTTNNQNSPSNYPKGKYNIKWDGFDSNGVYDSTIFTTGALKARIKGKRNGKEKTVESNEFEFNQKIKWVDVKIDKNSKRIDVMLRVNLTDGGAYGVDCRNVAGSIKEGIPPRTICPWDKIPKKAISTTNPIIKKRTKSFDELKQMVLDGINTYWSRRFYNTKGTIINNENWEIIVTAVNTDNSDISLNDIPLIYNTNNPWSRSGNPGDSHFGDGNMMDELAKLLPDGIVQRISYNVGYIFEYYYTDNWDYQKDNVEEEEFKVTSAHEIGHEILQAYGGNVYSWQHKGSSYYMPQDKKPIDKESFKEEYINMDYMEETKGENYPSKGNEVDLMKYYHNDRGQKNRIVAGAKDVQGLLWLTKLELK